MQYVHEITPADDTDIVLSGLFAALNLEGVAVAGERVPAHRGLDVPHHFARIREAISGRLAELHKGCSGECIKPPATVAVRGAW